MPVVVVADTGRVADWLTFAFEHKKIEDSEIEQLKEMIKAVYPIQYIEIFDDICLCMKQRAYVSKDLKVSKT